MEIILSVYGFVAAAVFVASFVGCYDLVGTVTKSGRFYGYLDHVMICTGVAITWPIMVLKSIASSKWWTE